MSPEPKDNKSIEQESVDSDEILPDSRRSFYLTLISYIFFFIASALYLYLSVVGLYYEKEVKDYPDELFDLDDDASWSYWGYEDDYVMLTPFTRVWVSEYQVVYFAAALGFVIAGLIDLYHWRNVMSIIMILAGSFGLASAAYVEKDETLSNKLNLVSVNLWVLESITVFYNRQSFGGELKAWLRTADCFFVLGTVMDVVISWFYLNVRGSVPLAKAEIASASCWMVCATLYVFTTIAIQRKSEFLSTPLTEKPDRFNKEDTVSMQASEEDQQDDEESVDAESVYI